MVFQTNVVGFSFRPVDALKCDPTGQFVQLRHEPMEKYPNAVSVHFNGHCIGYLPEPKDERDTQKQEIVNFIKEGREIHAIAVSCAFIEESEHGKPVHWYDTYSEGYGPLGTDDAGDVMGGDMSAPIQTILYRCALKITVDTGGIEQVNTENGRHYEQHGKRAVAISHIKELLPQKFDYAIKWAFDNFKNYEEYKSYNEETKREGGQTHGDIETAIKTGIATTRESTIALKLINGRECEVELRCFNHEILVAGTTDCLIEKDIVVDWKRGKKPKEADKIQVAFYATTLGATQAVLVYFGAENKQGYTVTKLDKEEIKYYYGIAVVLKQLHDVMQYEAKTRGQITD